MSDSDQRGESGDRDESGGDTCVGSPTSPQKKSKRWYKQPFNNEWLELDEFKNWLRPYPGHIYSARCSVCSQTLRGVNKSALLKHADTIKHIKNCGAERSPSSGRSSPVASSAEEFIDSTDWTKDRLQFLVSLYANEELLWNAELSDYHHKRPRKEAYNRIAEAMDLPFEAIVRKVRYLRTYYTRELLKMKRNPTGTQYKPSWPLYNIIDSFLRDHIQYHKATKVKYSPDNTGSDLDEDVGDLDDLQTEDIKLLMGQPVVIKTQNPESPLDESSSKRFRFDSQNASTKKAKLQSGSSEALIKLGSGRHSTEDPDSIFGRYVANELRLIKDLKSKQFAKLQIQNILFNAQFGLSAVPNEIILAQN